MARWGKAPKGPIGAGIGAKKKNHLVNKEGLGNGGWVTGWVIGIKKPTKNPTCCHS